MSTSDGHGSCAHRAGWDQADKDSVRSWLGDGHERFTDEQIDAAARTLAFPTARRVGLRLMELNQARAGWSGTDWRCPMCGRPTQGPVFCSVECMKADERQKVQEHRG